MKNPFEKVAMFGGSPLYAISEDATWDDSLALLQLEYGPAVTDPDELGAVDLLTQVAHLRNEAATSPHLIQADGVLRLGAGTTPDREYPRPYPKSCVDWALEQGWAKIDGDRIILTDEGFAAVNRVRAAVGFPVFAAAA